MLREGYELPVDPGPEHIPGLDVQVGRAAIDRRLDDLLDAAWLAGGGARADALAFFLSHSVSRLQVDHIGEWGPCKIAPDVLHDQPRLALPEACRHGGDMGAHEYARVAPEGMARRQRLRGEDIEGGAADSGGVENGKQGRLVQQRPARHVHHDAIVVNVSRGTLLDETALLAVLDASRVRGAALDGFAAEPLPAGHPFWRPRRALVTPHVAAVTAR